MRTIKRQIYLLTISTLTIFLSVLFSGCDLLGLDEEDDIQSEDARYFVLCEGNFGQNNASLWSIDESLSESSGPLVWNTATRPLGDVAQSMTLLDDELHIVLNNSHEIKTLVLGEDSLRNAAVSELSGMSPRQFLIQPEMNRGFVSSWGAGGIVVTDPGGTSLDDTISLGGLPGEMLISGEKLYVSMTSDMNWQSMDKVIELDISGDEPSISREFTVLPGPGSMALLQNQLYVTSLAYDPVTWAATTGTSLINLTTGAVSWVDHGVYQNFTADIDILNGIPYRVYGRSIVPIGSELRLIDDEAIGDLANIYSFSVQNGLAVIGTSDYVSPDSVHFYSGLGELQASLPVAGFPGQVLFYDPAE